MAHVVGGARGRHSCFRAPEDGSRIKDLLAKEDTNSLNCFGDATQPCHWKSEKIFGCVVDALESPHHLKYSRLEVYVRCCYPARHPNQG